MPVHQAAGVFIARQDCNKFGANPRFDKIGSTRAGLGGTWAADGRRDKERYNVGNPILICFGPILQKLDDAIYLKTYES